MERKKYFGIIIIILLLAFCSAANLKAEQYQFQDLGECTPQALNEQGEVVGSRHEFLQYPDLFLWTPKEGMRIIYKYAGWAIISSGINARQQIMATFDRIRILAVLWTEKEGETDLGGFGGYTMAYGINNLGEIVGGASDTYGSIWPHAFLWTRQEGLQVILPEGWSWAYAINDKSQVVGAANIGYSYLPFHAFLWTQQEGMQDLGTLPGGYNSQARAINNRTQVVGDAGFVVAGSYQYRAFLWTEKAGMKDLAPPDGHSYYAHGINDKGQVIGSIHLNTASYTNPVPFLWTKADGIQDLNDLVESLPEGGRLIDAAAINTPGQIVGQWLSKEGTTKGYLLTPANGK